MNFKESNNSLKKTIKNPMVFMFLGPETSKETLKKAKSHTRNTQKGANAPQKNNQKKRRKMPPW